MTTTAVTTKIATATMLPRDRVAHPVSPWPEVQAPAQRAPNPIRSPPANSVTTSAGSERYSPSVP